MKNLAIVIGTCDSHSFLWKGWWHYFKKNWNCDYPIYFLNETKDAPFAVTNIKVNLPDMSVWTKRIRESIMQIPEDDLLFMTEDAFVVKGFKHGEFENIYNTFKTLNADALRIRGSKSKHTTLRPTAFKANGITINKLDKRSKYLIAYSPNIWKKSFLLECLKYDETPWTNETIGSRRMEGKCNVYSYLKLGWWGNACKKGEITPEGKKLLKAI